MLISYYENGREQATPRSHRIVLGLIAANVAFVVVILCAWTIASFVIAEPIEWATWMPIGPANKPDDVLRYPFVLLWVMPAIGIATAWMAEKSRRTGMAITCALMPIAILLLIFGWFYLAPTTWH